MKRIATLAALVIGLALVPVQLAHSAPPGCVNHDGTDADKTTHFVDGTDGSYTANEVENSLTDQLGLTTSYAGGTVDATAVLDNTCRHGDYRFVVWADSERTTHLGTSASYIATGDEGPHDATGELYTVPFSVPVADSHTSDCVWVEGLATLRRNTLDETGLFQFCSGSSPGRTMF